MEPLEVRETDEIGRTTAVYMISPESGTSSRVDIINAINELPLTQRVLGIFLPSGYPHTVSPDYRPYQIYDSLQAFFSAIAGLLASRAVLQGLGVGDGNATATSAMLLNVAQESLGRFATIFFAHWGSKRIESDCKFYRLLADIVNDCAFVMDCLSPSLPKPLRMPLLCAASMCRAVCGVAAGSSKAILSVHFARANNIGELNAKDSSQETVISLLGMWAGGFVVSHVHGIFATWTWLLCLLGLHLTTNYLAVCSVSMTTLNRQRSNIVFSNMSNVNGEWQTLNPKEVAEQERIFAISGGLTWQGSYIASCKFGTFQDLLRYFGGTFNRITGSITDTSASLTHIFHIFKTAAYLLWFDPLNSSAIIVLKSHATAQTEIDAWWHGMRVTRALATAKYAQEVSPAGILQALEDTISSDIIQKEQMTALEKAGWDVSTSLLQTSSSSNRIHLHNEVTKVNTNSNAQVFQQDLVR